MRQMTLLLIRLDRVHIQQYLEHIYRRTCYQCPKYMFLEDIGCTKLQESY